MFLKEIPEDLWPKKLLFLFFAVLTGLMASAQAANDLLDKAISYHDPQGIWPSFHGQLFVTMQTPDKADRISEISMNLPAEYFKLKVTREGITSTQILDKEVCTLSLNGSDQFSEEAAKTHSLNCDRTKVMRNYYTYLYGLPMKLKDPGTRIDPTVLNKTFKGKEYLVLKVTYEEGIGEDTWYFYFDPSTYAMQVYQFYHDQSENDGEYILLSHEEEVSGIKMPKTRAWFYNKDDQYLGTDILTRATSL